MEEPKLEVSLLEGFPPDIWAYLVCYLPGEQLARLLMTGTARLWQRLKFPTVVKSINLGKDHIGFKSFPRFLNAFPSLEELSIHSFGDNWSNEFGLRLDIIPSGVRKLELTGTWKNSTVHLFGSPTTTLKLCDHLPHLEALHLNYSNIADYSWMTHSPQSLIILSLQEWDGTAELPSSLIHFNVDHVTLSTGSFVSKLPPSLESFVVSSWVGGVDLVLPLLPPSTYKLSLGHSPAYSEEHRSPQNLLEQIPKFLTWFQVPLVPEIDFLIYPELASLLPSTLTELHLAADFPCSAWPLLPRQISTLRFRAPWTPYTEASTFIDNHGVQHQVDSVPFDTLPRSLTKLELLENFKVKFCGPPTTFDHSFFPPQLTHLKIPDIQLSPETAKLLPSTLTHLEIGNCCERVCQHLPTSLKTFISRRTLVSPNWIKFLPKSLTSFRSAVAHSQYPWFDHETGEVISSINELPEYSIHKMCLSNSFNWEGSPRLPPTLTDWHLDDAHTLGDSFLEHQQLPNLLRWHLGHSAHFSDLSIPMLPRYLNNLNLASSSKISGKSFGFLPRHLTCLNLNSSDSIADSDIQHLPRTLKLAQFNHAMHLTDLCIPDLPPRLESLSMRFNTQITPSSLPHFPSPLLSRHTYGSARFSNWCLGFGEVVQTAPNRKYLA